MVYGMDPNNIVIKRLWCTYNFHVLPPLQNLPSDSHVIAVDLPGHGDSDTPTDDYDISHMNTVLRMNKVTLHRSR